MKNQKNKHINSHYAEEELQRHSGLHKYEVKYITLILNSSETQIISRENIKKILGFDDEISVKDFIMLIHPDFRSWFLAYRKAFQTLVQKQDSIGRSLIKCAFHACFPISSVNNVFYMGECVCTVEEQGESGAPRKIMYQYFFWRKYDAKIFPKNYTIELFNKFDESMHREKALLDKIAASYLVESLPFTPRELEICEYTLVGLTQKEIAIALDISRQTVSTHCRNMIKKGKRILPHLIDTKMIAHYLFERKMIENRER